MDPCYRPKAQLPDQDYVYPESEVNTGSGSQVADPRGRWALARSPVLAGGEGRRRGFSRRVPRVRQSRAADIASPMRLVRLIKSEMRVGPFKRAFPALIPDVFVCVLRRRSYLLSRRRAFADLLRPAGITRVSSFGVD